MVKRGIREVIPESKLHSVITREADSLNKSLVIIDFLSSKYGLKSEDVISLLQNKQRYAPIPIGLFKSNLCPLESLVRYLKDKLGYNFAQIAKLLDRDTTTVWTSYNNSIKKCEKFIYEEQQDENLFKKLGISREDFFIPLNKLSKKQLSILESVCLYLKEEFDLNYHNIGILLARDERTIWTCVSRAKKKLGYGAKQQEMKATEL